MSYRVDSIHEWIQARVGHCCQCLHSNENRQKSHRQMLWVFVIPSHETYRESDTRTK
jgi:hypothetical protein